jgi:hypothetical protein
VMQQQQKLHHEQQLQDPNRGGLRGCRIHGRVKGVVLAFA